MALLTPACARPASPNHAAPALQKAGWGHVVSLLGQEEVSLGRVDPSSPCCNPTFCAPNQPVFLLTHGTRTFSPRDATLSLSSPCTWLEAWGLRRHGCTSLFLSHAAHPGRGTHNWKGRRADAGRPIQCGVGMALHRGSLARWSCFAGDCAHCWHWPSSSIRGPPPLPSLKRAWHGLSPRRAADSPSCSCVVSPFTAANCGSRSSRFCRQHNLSQTHLLLVSSVPPQSHSPEVFSRTVRAQNLSCWFPSGPLLSSMAVLTVLGMIKRICPRLVLS